MEISITGRQVTISDRFRSMVHDKVAKVSQLAPKTHRVDVEVSHERNPRQTHTSEKVEITVRGKGPVIRAEARAEESTAAFDVALGKLLERLRRNSDRRKGHHPQQAAEFAAELIDAAHADAEHVDTTARPDAAVDPAEAEQSAVALVIRTKEHAAEPMSLDQALYEMELVGHDFFLFVDDQSATPSVVYRRQGWQYGVIRLSHDGTSA